MIYKGYRICSKLNFEFGEKKSQKMKKKMYGNRKIFAKIPSPVKVSLRHVSTRETFSPLRHLVPGGKRGSVTSKTIETRCRHSANV